MNDTITMFVRALTVYMNEKGIKEFKVKWSDIDLVENNGQMIVITDKDDPDSSEFCTVALLTKEEAEAYLNEYQEGFGEGNPSCACCDKTDCESECTADVDADCEPVYEDAPKCNCNCGCKES